MILCGCVICEGRLVCVCQRPFLFALRELLSFLCSYILVLNNLPFSPIYAAPQLVYLVHEFTLFFRFYIAFGCTDIRLRVVWGRCGHPVLLQYPIKTLWCTFHVWDDDLASVVLVLVFSCMFLLFFLVNFFKAKDR